MDSHETNTPLHKKFVFSLLGVALLCGLSEIGLRIFGFMHFPAVVPPIIWNGDEDRNLNHGLGMFVEDKAQLWIPRAGVEVPYGAAQAECISADGYRGPLRSKKPSSGVLRIVALGDSSTFGMGVPYEDTYCAQLEAQLAALGLHAEVIDAGVIGFTIEQGLERYDALVHELSPDIVIAGFGAINEHLWAQTLADRPKINGRKRPDPVKHMLVQLRYNVRLLHLAGWIIDRARGEDREALREALKAERKRQDAFNVGAGRPDWTGERRVSLARFAAAHDELAARVHADHAQLVLISMPRLPEREVDSPVLPLYNQAVHAAAQRLNAGFFDARAAVTAALQGPPPREWSELFIDAYHPNRAGHALIAAGLVPIIQSMSTATRANSPASGH